MADNKTLFFKIPFSAETATYAEDGIFMFKFKEAEMENIKVGYYAIIPATVRYDKRLKANEKLLYGEITALCNERGYCWARNSYFADLYDVSIGTVSKWFSNLAETNYITIEMIYKNNSREIDKRIIRIKDNINQDLSNTNDYIQPDNEDGGIVKKDKGYSQKELGVPSKRTRGIVENDKDNNTINNKNNNTDNKKSTKVDLPKNQDLKSKLNPIQKATSKTSKSSRVQEFATMSGMLNVFSSNDDVIDALKEYYSIRSKKGLKPTQWKIILDDLKQFCKNNESLMIEKIRNATAGGYMQIIASWEKGKTGSGKKSFDNTSEHQPESYLDGTREDFENDLARNEDGSLMEF